MNGWMGFKTNEEKQHEKAETTRTRQAESVSIPTHPLRAANGRGWVGSETREAHEKAFLFKGESPSFCESERDYAGLREPCGS